MFELIAH